MTERLPHDVPQPQPKILTLVEANARLPQVIQVVERLRQLQQAHEELPIKLAGGNGHSQSSLKEQLITEVRAALLKLDAFGALLKDPKAGLVDFYGQRAGELILLCWRLGEEERIGFWHTLEGGFAGRQPVDSLIQ